MATPRYPHKQQKSTQKRMEELEAVFQEQHDDLRADFESYDLSVMELKDKWGVSERTLRRWMERMDISSDERNKERRRRDTRTHPPKQIRRVKSAADYDKPQAHKLAGLW